MEEEWLRNIHLLLRLMITLEKGLVHCALVLLKLGVSTAMAVAGHVRNTCHVESVLLRVALRVQHGLRHEGLLRQQGLSRDHHGLELVLLLIET